MRQTLLIIALVIGFISIKGYAIDRPLTELACKHVNPIEMSYLARHVTYSTSNRNLETRTIEQFIKQLDSSKIYLLKNDVEKIKKMMTGVFAQTKAQDCKAIRKAYDIYTNRVRERVAFAAKYLGPKFKFDQKTTITLDPEKREYASSLATANEFHKKYIQFQISNYLATDLKLEEAKSNVAKNYERIKRRIEETKNIDLLSLYLDAFARSLDPHSSYLSADALEDFEIQMRLSLEGIGATLSSRDGFTVIEQLIPGGAAAESLKLKPKDKIIAVAQGTKGTFENVIEKDLREVVRKIRGKKGTKVQLSILRKEGSTTKRFNVTLVRDKIKLEDEAAALTYIDREVNGKKVKVGLLSLPSFYADHRSGGRSAADDMKKLLREARKNKAQSLVVDFSTNGGGSLDDAVKIAGLFFKEGNVVKQSHRDPNRGELVLADEDAQVDWAGPMVVLISRISASASEIVAGTLKDYQRAIIVGGDHTFGKGSVQSVEPLPKGLGALKTTVGMFFTPGGTSTQHIGVDADIEFPNTYSSDEIGEKTLDYSLPPKKIKPFLSAEAYVVSGDSVWERVSKKTINKLQMSAKLRIEASSEFAEVKENIAKAKKREQAIVVGEILKDKEENKEDKDSDKVLSYADQKKKKEEDYMKRADIQEAINIAADLYWAQKNIPLTIGAQTKAEPVRAN